MQIIKMMEVPVYDTDDGETIGAWCFMCENDDAVGVDYRSLLDHIIKGWRLDVASTGLAVQPGSGGLFFLRDSHEFVLRTSKNASGIIMAGRIRKPKTVHSATLLPSWISNEVLDSTFVLTCRLHQSFEAVH